jgi:hypothetical protein
MRDERDLRWVGDILMLVSTGFMLTVTVVAARWLFV